MLYTQGDVHWNVKAAYPDPELAGEVRQALEDRDCLQAAYVVLLVQIARNQTKTQRSPEPR
jgi:hypothetical protein